MRNVTPIEAATTESRLRLMKAAPDFRDLLFDVLDAIDGMVDVSDESGSDGVPGPNWAMTLKGRIERTLAAAGVSLE